MTKFEEEFKALSSWDWVNVDLIQQILTRFGNWHSDEEFQAKEKEIKRLRKINHLYKKAKGNAERLAVDRGERLNQTQDELASLESQLQQQALPVVPECVAEFVSGDENEFSKADRIAYLLQSIQGDSYYLTKELPRDGMITVDEGQELYNWAICQHHETILKLWNGYTVEKPQIEKPQLFYIDLPKVFGLSDSTSDSTFVSKAESGIISEFTKGKDYALKLTEQEIKSIDERYWQFAVPVEDGE